MWCVISHVYSVEGSARPPPFPVLGVHGKSVGRCLCSRSTDLARVCACWLPTLPWRLSAAWWRARAVRSWEWVLVHSHIVHAYACVSACMSVQSSPNNTLLYWLWLQRATDSCWTLLLYFLSSAKEKNTWVSQTIRCNRKEMEDFVCTFRFQLVLRWRRKSYVVVSHVARASFSCLRGVLVKFWGFFYCCLRERARARERRWCGASGARDTRGAQWFLR